MAMFRYITVILLLSTFWVSSVAQNNIVQNSGAPKRTVNHNQDFSLSRNIVVTVPSYLKDVRADIESVVVENGGGIENNFFKRLFSSPKIIVRQAGKITGARGDNALQIAVSYDKVTITYTTELSLQRGLELLRGQVVFRNGGAMIGGTDVIDWVDVDYSPKRKRSGDLDLTSATTLLPKSQLEALIAHTKRGDILELTVVSPTGWVIETPALEGINPHHKIYSPVGHYGLTQLRSLNDYAASRGVELVLKTNVLDSNERFEATTGFAMNSVEGMRFVRAMFTQWTTITGITTFVVGDEGTEVDGRYGEFLDFLEKNLNIKFIRSN